MNIHMAAIQQKELRITHPGKEAWDTDRRTPRFPLATESAAMPTPDASRPAPDSPGTPPACAAEAEGSGRSGSFDQERAGGICVGDVRCDDFISSTETSPNILT